MIFMIEASTNGPRSLFCSSQNRASLHRLQRSICSVNKISLDTERQMRLDDLGTF